MQKFKKGDKVRIIKYGHFGWYSNLETLNNFKNLNKKMEKDFTDTLVWGIDLVKELPNEMPNEDFSHLIIDDKNGITIDESPYLVGKEGIIEGSYFDLYGSERWDEEEKIRTRKTYSIKGIVEKSAWYDEQQLELINE